MYFPKDLKCFSTCSFALHSKSLHAQGLGRCLIRNDTCLPWFRIRTSVWHLKTNHRAIPILSQCRLLTEVLIQVAPSLEMGKSSAYHLVPISQLMGQRHKPVKQVGLFPNENQMCWIPPEYWVHSLSRVLAGAEGCPYLIFTTNQPQHSFTWKISNPNKLSVTVARNYNRSLQGAERECHT